MALRAGERLGPYEILGALGAGGMGEVYRARDTRLGRDVAIKVLPGDVLGGRRPPPPLRARGPRRRRRSTTRTSSPSTTSGTTRARPTSSRSCSRARRCASGCAAGALPVRKAVELRGCRSRAGLAAAHDKGIVHRDLKPENLFLTTDGRREDPRLRPGAAGRARAGRRGPTRSPTADARHTTPGAVMGTVGYMSPEQVRGEAADHRSDIFALGAVLYEMLTGPARVPPGHAGRDAERDPASEEPPELPADRRDPAGARPASSGTAWRRSRRSASSRRATSPSSWKG